MEQKNLLIALALSILILLGWGLLFPPPKRPVEPLPPPVEQQPAPAPALPAPAPEAASQEASSDTSPPPVDVEAVEATSEEEVVLETSIGTVRLSNRGAQLTSLRLASVEDHEGRPLEMVRARKTGPYPFALVDSRGEPLAVNDALFVVEGPSEQGAPGTASVRFRYSGSAGRVTKEFRFGTNGMFEVSIEAEGLGDWGLLQGPGLRNPSSEELNSRYQVRAASHSTDSVPKQFLSARLKGEERIPGQGISWFALEDTYFLAMLAPQPAVAEVVIQPVLMEREGEGAPAVFTPRPPELSEAQEGLPQEARLILFPGGPRLEGTAYWGPKSYRKLAALPFDLERTIRWGLKIPVVGAVLDPLVSLLSRVMLFLLLWIHDHVIANFGWSIVLLTVFIKLVLFPLTHKSYVSMQKMQQLSPKMEAIKHKYRSKQRDKQGRPNMESQRKMNEEMQALFRSEGVNPASGCLPLLLQMPVFFAFFSLLRNSVELWNAPWVFWIHDLSAADPIYILPIVMGAAQFVQQRMTPVANTNPGQKIFLSTMPIWFTVISFGFASGLVLYWLTNNILTIFQQGIYQRLKKAGKLGGLPAPAVQTAKSKASHGKERAQRGRKR